MSEPRSPAIALFRDAVSAAIREALEDAETASFERCVAAIMGERVNWRYWLDLDYRHDAFTGAPTFRTCHLLHAEPSLGWIVGCRHLREGIPDSGDYDDEGGRYGGGLDVRATIPAVEVRHWPGARSLFVPPEEVDLGWYGRLPARINRATWKPQDQGRYLANPWEDAIIERAKARKLQEDRPVAATPLEDAF